MISENKEVVWESCDQGFGVTELEPRRLSLVTEYPELLRDEAELDQGIDVSPEVIAARGVQARYEKPPVREIHKFVREPFFFKKPDFPRYRK